MSEIERIAAGLSEDAKRDFLGYRQHTISPANIHILSDAGLIEWIDFPNLKTTPLGLRVRAHLQEQTP